MNTYYLINLLIYAAVDGMACLGLSQQFGVGGVTNFGFIIFQAAGGYTAAILAMPPDSANGGFQSYIGGWNLPFPVPWIGAAVAGGVIALPFTFLVGRRLRGDFAAVGLLVTAVLLNLLATNFVPAFNGDAGLSLIPQPLQGEFIPQSSGYQWGFTVVALLLCAGVYVFLRRITESPYGRSLRAMRDNDVVADSLGKNLLSLRTGMLVLGGAIAGLSGGVLVSYITTWSPAAWGYAETVVLFAAVIIGGTGNHRGALLGAVLVPVGFEEVTRFIPTSNNLPPNLIPSLEWVAIGLLILVFLWFRPQGVLPERKRVIALPGDHSPAVAVRERPAGPARTPAAPSAGQAQPPVVLEAADLTRDFGGVRAVDGVSLAVRQGTLTGLIGPNGAGKSTLLAILAGTLPASSGTVVYLGQDVTASPAFRRARLGLVRTFQLASEFKRLTVMENLLSAVPGNRGDSLRGAIAGKRYWKADETAAIARAQSVLARFGLEGLANDYAGDLSGGQRRLVEIMRALMAEPGMLLLDEPMAGVHPHLARRIGNELVALCREGMTVLMVEHELAIMDEFCDPVAVMADGRVLAEGTMAELRRRSEVVEAYLAAADLALRGLPLRASGITAGYGADPVIRDITVAVAPGQVASLVGPNGSGKSTLLKSLVGIVHVASGTVLVGDRDVTNQPPEEIARAGVGYVPQVDDVFGPLSVRENLEMGGYLLRKPQIAGHIERVLAVFPRLAGMLGRTAGKLSGGERKMLAMGRVLMLDPGVFLLDEPTANLAPVVAAELLDEHVRQLASGGAAVLIVEQRARAVLAISDRAYVLGGGEVRMEGSPAELAASPDFIESFLGGGRERGTGAPA